MSPTVTMKALLESGVHFGHRTNKWNPKMRSYIFTERNGIHIIDLQQTVKLLDEAYDFVRDNVIKGGTVLFVGTKRQAQDTISDEAERCGMPYVNERWLGGTITNWITIQKRIFELERLERMRDSGQVDLLTKKEGLMIEREIERLDKRLHGIRTMKQMPDILFVVDVTREDTSVHEANLKGIPVVAMVDTNCDPKNIDYIIPSNDDAIRAIKLLVGKIADAVMEGKDIRSKEAEEEEVLAESIPAEIRRFTEEEEFEDKELLGESTLKYIDSAKKSEPQKEPLEGEDEVQPSEEEEVTEEETEAPAQKDEKAPEKEAKKEVKEEPKKQAKKEPKKEPQKEPLEGEDEGQTSEEDEVAEEEVEAPAQKEDKAPEKEAKKEAKEEPKKPAKKETKKESKKEPEKEPEKQAKKEPKKQAKKQDKKADEEIEAVAEEPKDKVTADDSVEAVEEAEEQAEEDVKVKEDKATKDEA